MNRNDSVFRLTSYQAGKAGLGGDFIKCVRKTVTYEDFDAEATTDFVDFDDAIPAESVVVAVTYDVDTLWDDGASQAQADITLGISGDTDKFASTAIDVDLGSGSTGTARVPVEEVHSTAAGATKLLFLGAIDGVSSNAAQRRYVHRGPDMTIESISTVANQALTSGPATVTASIGGMDVTDGVVTIASGGAEDDVDVATPSAANTLTEGDVLTLTVGGTNDAAGTTLETTVELRETTSPPLMLGAATTPRITMTSDVDCDTHTQGQATFYVWYINPDLDLNYSA